jgi:hypothetical protein
MPGMAEASSQRLLLGESAGIDQAHRACPAGGPVPFGEDPEQFGEVNTDTRCQR